MRFNQLRQLVHLLIEEIDAARAAGQPEDEFVQKQDYAIVAEVLRMTPKNGHALVDVEVFALLHDRGDQVLHEIAHQVAMPIRGRIIGRRRIAFRRPSAGKSSPASTAAALPLVQGIEERLIAHFAAQAGSILENRLRAEKRRDRRVRVMILHPVHVTLEDLLFERARPDHVVGHHQESFSRQPCVVLLHHRGQLRQRPRLVVPLQQQVEYRHEVGLPGAETAVQVAAPALAGVHRSLDEAQRVIEILDQFLGNHVAAQRGARVRDASGQLQDEVVFVDALLDVDEFSDQHGRG